MKIVLCHAGLDPDFAASLSSRLSAMGWTVDDAGGESAASLDEATLVLGFLGSDTLASPSVLAQINDALSRGILIVVRLPGTDPETLPDGLRLQAAVRPASAQGPITDSDWEEIKSAIADRVEVLASRTESAAFSDFNAVLEEAPDAAASAPMASGADLDDVDFDAFDFADADDAAPDEREDRPAEGLDLEEMARIERDQRRVRAIAAEAATPRPKGFGSAPSAPSATTEAPALAANRMSAPAGATNAESPPREVSRRATSRKRAASPRRRASSQPAASKKGGGCLYVLLGTVSALAAGAFIFREELSAVFDNALALLGMAALPGTADPPLDVVEASVFAPHKISPGRIIQVQLFLHTPDREQRDQSASEALAMDSRSALRRRRPLDMDIPRGARITAELFSDDKDTSETFGLGTRTVETLVWRGEPVSASFLQRVGKGAKEGEHILRCLVSVDGAPAGELAFTVVIGTAESETNTSTLAETEADRYHKVFLSYAREDVDRVRMVARACETLGLEYFWDVESLRAGEDYESRLFEMVDSADALLLFWTEHAKGSDMVRREVRRALDGEKRSGKPRLIPFPLEGPPIPDPWEEIAGKHIGDPVYYRSLTGG